MDKNAIKKYAVWARRELIGRVAQRALLYGITEQDAGDADAERVNGRPLTAAEIIRRRALIRRVREKGYEAVIEEAAYTWFNRFTALRFMEVNGYLPSHVRVFTDETGAFRPQILSEAIHLDLEGLDREKVYALEDEGSREELFKYLLIVQCNALSGILPGMFRRIEDYAELLLPDNLLREGSVLERLVTGIPEADWTDQVQIIGWLYQYYNTEPKDRVFAGLKRNIKITREELPAATQLFTPDWIVRYMVENSLGRLWLEGHPDEKLRAGWKYYLDEAPQEPEVEAQLAAIRAEHSALRPEDMKIIDPCMGSGHILLYAFDLLMQIYEKYGVSRRDAVKSILEHNLYGLDIDERAAQLAYFTVMMKARQYDRRFFSHSVQPHVYSTACFPEGAEYGSLLLTEDPGELPGEAGRPAPQDGERQVRRLLARKYHAVVTNPPYMAVNNLSRQMGERIKAGCPSGKTDLFAAFILRCRLLTQPNGYQAMITQHSWMFLSSYEKLREKLLRTADTVNLLHLGARAFEEIGGEVVRTCGFVFRCAHLDRYAGTWCRLVEPHTQRGKEELFLSGENRTVTRQDKFSRIPGSPFAYWASDRLVANFSSPTRIEDLGVFTGAQNITGDNGRFLRYHWEVAGPEIDRGRWVFYAKGGEHRRYYGNLTLVVDWSESARSFYAKNKSSNLLQRELWFREGITYSAVTSRGTSFRYLPAGCVFDKGGPSICVESQALPELLALLNSKVARLYFGLFNPSINLQVKDIKALPILLSGRREVSDMAFENIRLSKADWDSFETSREFQRHPLVRGLPSLEASFAAWERECEERFQALKANEEALNRVFIDLYGLRDELTAETEDRDVTVRRADLGREVRSLISYAVGCMFGRYSLDRPGLAYAGGDWDEGRYSTYLPDRDNILPICDDEYFDGDITGKFVRWVEVVYGKEALEENLRFIAAALGGRGTPRQALRQYFLHDFYADHLKMYWKRPIYWLFDSGKKNGLKCLVYMHRCRPDTVARVRTDYAHQQQARYRAAIAALERQLEGTSPAERAKGARQLQKLRDQAEELRVYEEKLRHLADRMLRLDANEGVKHNHALFGDVLARLG